MNANHFYILAELYGPYEPVQVVGLHLLRGYLPACDWIRPDFEDVKKYAKLWHTDNKEDLVIHHDIGNDEKRIIDRCSFYGFESFNLFVIKYVNDARNQEDHIHIVKKCLTEIYSLEISRDRGLSGI
ncbi:unnamed protein product [Meloidogyne enterolobii]|uniref:Uncharacterized protein n=1 Tax=Meloidogyne enterolobii TaxID=390850 RepID=A0ACB0XS63_MELEN